MADHIDESAVIRHFCGCAIETIKAQKRGIIKWTYRIDNGVPTVRIWRLYHDGSVDVWDMTVSAKLVAEMSLDLDKEGGTN